MADKKAKNQNYDNVESEGEPIPFDEALRRLVNTPPKHKKPSATGGAGKAKPRQSKRKKAC